MSYDRTVAAALTETSSKFALAEALATDIPPRRTGPTAGDDKSVPAYLEEARQAVIDAGGEPREVASMKEYRATALWVLEEKSLQFRWISGYSYSAHNEARRSGLSYDEFATEPMSANDLRKRAGKAPSTYRGPEYQVSTWTPEEKASAARELLSDPEIAEEIAGDITEHVASDPKRTADVVFKRRQQEQRRGPVEEPERRPSRDYDALIEQHVNGLTVALAAESSGKWEPSERSEALLYFLTQILGKRNEPTGEQADFVNEKLDSLFAEIEAYANSEAV